MQDRERGRRGAGHLESEVLAALWTADRPLTPGETVEAMETVAGNVVTLAERLRRVEAALEPQRLREQARAGLSEERGRNRARSQEGDVGIVERSEGLECDPRVKAVRPERTRE